LDKQKPSTPTLTLTHTPSPTATWTPTATPVPPTATPSPIPPTATPTRVPIVILTGRVLYANSDTPVADSLVRITNKEGAVSFGAGKLLNPAERIDAAGTFTVEIKESFLKEQDYEFMVAVNVMTKLTFVTTSGGIPVVMKVESVPVDIDLGDIFVKR
jgi:hypothetical protein